MVRPERFELPTSWFVLGVGKFESFDVLYLFPVNQLFINRCRDAVAPFTTETNKSLQIPAKVPQPHSYFHMFVTARPKLSVVRDKQSHQILD